jgi:DNA processing protein
MSAAGQDRASSSACPGCVRRSWLLSELSVPLEYLCRDRGRLGELLGLSDDDLLRALAGRRRKELRSSYARFEQADLRRMPGVQAVCRHHRSYPSALRDPGGPWMLNVAGGVRRLRDLAAAPTVAIIGSSRATDYGVEMARSIARGLAASGVTVAGGLSDGIAAAAHAGALEAGSGSVAVMPGGLDVACAARRRSLYERVRLTGCAVAELPCGVRPRRFGQVAGERTIARLAGLTVVVEARDSPGELAGARLAQALGRTVAAVPGRVTSRASSGTHALLMDGAHLVRGPGDALELLCAPQARAAQPPKDAAAELAPRLRTMLEKVGAGSDTPDKLTGAGEEFAEVLLTLSELELMGLLVRGDGGRYLPRCALIE